MTGWDFIGARVLGLRRGNSGERVLDLQFILNQRLNRNLVVDGVFGPQTEQAVRDFQQWKGIPQTGTVNVNTAKSIQDEARIFATSTGTQIAGWHIGWSGHPVLALQYLLKRHGYLQRTRLHEEFDKEVEDALIKWQTDNGFTATGMVERDNVPYLLNLPLFPGQKVEKNGRRWTGRILALVGLGAVLYMAGRGR